jgi:hypothetical protein
VVSVKESLELSDESVDSSSLGAPGAIVNEVEQGQDEAYGFNSRRSQLCLLLNRQFAHAPASFELSSGLSPMTHILQVPLLSLQKLHGSAASVPRVWINAAVNAVLSLSGLRIGWPSPSIRQSKMRMAGSF